MQQPIKIEIELVVEETDGIKTSDWQVRVGDRVAKFMCWDEMLGLVVSLTVPEERRQLQWLRTPQQWDDMEKLHERRIANRDAERRAEEEGPVT